MMNEDIKFHVQNNWQIETIGILGKTISGYTIKPVLFEKSAPGEMIQPFMELNRESAQRLLDELYQVGLRPSKKFWK